MITIALEGMQFFSHHGWYPQERVLGNHFEVELAVDYPETGLIGQLADTINYEVLFQMVGDQMKAPQLLMETVCQRILTQIHQQFPFVTRISVTLRKKNPPLEGRVENSLVKLEKEW
ncbi:MAG: dihydroneopterin aldolase [Chitinophagaceae bacterium]